ncbi:MAG TPA: response regulator [Chthoniobacteraceae bacterium]|nr:response regulator [Chthoniobacteraceae bacterium]
MNPVGDVKSCFGRAVRSERFALHISQEELADRAGLHRTYISDVERGTRNLSLESIGKLAAALKLSVAGLFERADPERTSERLIEILLVEDNPDDIALTRRAFWKARIANPLHVVRDGAEALEFLFATGPYAGRRAADLPGVILLDLNLPQITGLEVLRRIKSDPRTREVPVVVLTVSNDDGDIAACRQLGVQSYIVKPVGFQNFSEVTPHLLLEWALKKSTRGGAVEAGGHEPKVD